MKSENIILSLITLLLLTTSSFAQAEYAKLRPSSNYWDRDAKHVPVKISRLSQNRKLATVGDMLYMLDARNQIVWSWSSGGAPLTDIPVMDSKGTIYAIGLDLIWAALDSANGKEKWRGTANGRAVYSQIELYKGDMYLVVTNMEGYRENLSDKTIEDNLTLCRGNTILWATHIPANAKIQVRGGKVFALIRRKHSIMKREITIPRSFGKPIGKVSALAD
jgi:outer membrane protein assembly factor BamB